MESTRQVIARKGPGYCYVWLRRVWPENMVIIARRAKRVALEYENKGPFWLEEGPLLVV